MQSIYHIKKEDEDDNNLVVIKVGIKVVNTSIINKTNLDIYLHLLQTNK